MSHFIYPVNCLSQGNELFFTELSYANYKVLNKMIVNNDLPSLCRFLDTLLEELCTEPNRISTLTALDKFYILIFLYSINVSTVVPFTLTCPTTKKKFNTDFELISLLERLEAIPLKHCFSVTEQNVQYNFVLPKSFQFEFKEEELFNSCLLNITIQEQNLVFSQSQLQNTNNVLPFVVAKKAWNWLLGVLEEFQKFLILNVRSPYVKEDVFVSYTPTLFSSDLLEFLISVFRDNLQNFYQTEYNFVTKHSFSLADFRNLTPAEITVWENIDAKSTKNNTALPSKQEIVK